MSSFVHLAKKRKERKERNERKERKNKGKTKGEKKRKERKRKEVSRPGIELHRAATRDHKQLYIFT